MKSLRGLKSILWFVLLAVCAASAQEPIPATSAYEDHGEYSINLQNLSIDLNVNFRNKSGLVPFSASSRATANFFTGGNTVAGHANYLGGGASSILPVATAATQIRVLSGTGAHASCPDNTGTSEVLTWFLTDANGNMHATVPVAGSNPYVDQKADGTSCLFSSTTVATNDGSGYTAVITTAPFHVTVYDTGGGSMAGTVGLFSNGPVSASFSGYRDSNGNTVSVNTTVMPQIYTDSLGLTALTVNSTFNPTFSWTDVNGGTQQVAVTQASLMWLTAFGCPAPSLDLPAAGSAVGYMSNVLYANGTNLAVTYEQTPGKTSAYTTGRITNLKLPAGGNVAFSYSGFQCSYLEPTTMTRTTADGSYTYTWAPAASGGNTTTVTDPAGNTTVYTFNASITVPPTSSQVPVPRSVVRNQGASTVLSTTTYCYNAAVNCAAPVLFPITQIDTYTIPAGQRWSNQHETTMDTMGNVLTTASYDFGVATPAFVTTNTYGSWNGTACAPVGNFIVNKPCDVVTTDGAGNKIFETRATYDTAGNLLASYAWNGTTFLGASATYNANGTLHTSTAVDGTLTSLTYGACNGAFPTQTTTGTLSTYDTWNCDGGVKTSATGSNGDTYTYGYVDSASNADPLWRSTSRTDFAGNVAWTIYGANTLESKASFGTSIEDVVTTVDGYGRKIRVQTKHGMLYDTATYKYNLAANTTSVSVPCTVALGVDCTTGFTTSTMDGAGRIVSMLDGGGGATASVFYGKDVTSTSGPAPTGESSKSVVTEFDGLGRTTSICAILSSGGSSCGQQTTGSGIATSFVYATTAGTSTVTATRGAQTKTYVSDALGRQTQTTFPESGTMKYYYDAQAACPGSMNGHLTIMVYPNGNGICYYYDNLGRVSLMSASGVSTQCRAFYYDNSNGFTGTRPTGVAPTYTLGRLVEAVTTNCASTIGVDEWFGYDLHGNLTDVWEKTGHSGGFYHTTATYAPNGAPLSLSGIPNYPAIAYGLDYDGRLSTAVDGGRTIVAGVMRGPVGALFVSIGSGTDEDAYLYDVQTGRTTQYQFYVGPANTKGVLSWNANGSLGSLAITDGFNAGGTHTCSFSYDDIARLTVDNCGAVWSQTFSYDQYDNLTKAGSSIWNPGYNAANNRYSSIGATYNANGSLTYDSFNHYTYDDFNKLSTVTASTVSCGSTGTCIWNDAFGRAVEMSNGSSYSQLLYSPFGKTAQMNGQTTMASYKPLPGGGTLYSSGATGTTNKYWHKDWLGSVRVASSVLSSGNGLVSFDRAFAPYSEQYLNFGSTTAPDFTGDTQDIFSGLFDTPNRELSSSQSRWITPDPVGAGWNAYAYGTDPNRTTDPTGLMQFPQIETQYRFSGMMATMGDAFWNEFQRLDITVDADKNGPVVKHSHDPACDEYCYALETATQLFPERFNDMGMQYGMFGDIRPQLSLRPTSGSIGASSTWDSDDPIVQFFGAIDKYIGFHDDMSVANKESLVNMLTMTALPVAPEFEGGSQAVKYIDYQLLRRTDLSSSQLDKIMSVREILVRAEKAGADAGILHDMGNVATAALGYVTEMPNNGSFMKWFAQLQGFGF